MSVGSFVVFACRQEVTSQIALVATHSIQGNSTAECVDGNVHVVSPQNNVEKSEIATLAAINKALRSWGDPLFEIGPVLSLKFPDW